jgi:hypothetical protein
MDAVTHQVIRATVQAVPELRPLLSPAALKAAKQFVSYQALRDDYFARIYDSVDGYLNSDKPITLFRNSDRNLIRDYYQEAAEIGYEDGGATLPLDDATQALVDAGIADEISHVDDLFIGLRDNPIADYSSEALARSTGYANSLDTVYNLGKMSAAGNKMGTWHLGATEKHCPTCSSLDGQRHRMSWFISHDWLPRSRKLKCKGYNCDCSIVDDEGDEVTI